MAKQSRHSVPTQVMCRTITIAARVSKMSVARAVAMLAVHWPFFLEARRRVANHLRVKLWY